MVAFTTDTGRTQSGNEGQDQPVDSGGGVIMPTSNNWPLTDENCIPSSVRILVDADKNGVCDHVATVAVKLVDLNRDGKWTRYTDGVFIDPRAVERIDPSVRLSFGDADWRAACKRAAAGL